MPWAAQTTHITPETNDWMFSGQWTATGAETAVFIYSTDIPEIITRGAYIVIDGMCVGASLAGGGNVYVGVVHEGKVHISLHSFAVGVGTATARTISPLGLPLDANGELVHITVSMAAADAVRVSMWGHWRVPIEAHPQPVAVKSVQLFPDRPRTGAI